MKTILYNSDQWFDGKYPRIASHDLTVRTAMVEVAKGTEEKWVLKLVPPKDGLCILDNLGSDLYAVAE